MIKKNKKIKTIILIVLLIALFFIIGLNIISISDFKNSQNEKQIKIGAILPLTGFAAARGVETQQGIEIAIEEFNNKGNLQAEIIYGDSSADAGKAVIEANKLINIDKVKAIIGPLASSPAIAVSEIAQNNKIIMITPIANHPAITKNKYYVFRTIMTSDQEGKAILKLIRGQNKKEVAIISLNNDYGEAILKVLEKSKTIKIISEEKYNLGEKDFKSILTKVKSLNPEIIILIGYSEVGTILKQAKGLGIGCLFISGAPFEGEDTLKNAEGSAEEVLYVFHKTTQSKESYFYTNYLKKYEKQPSIYSIFAYDSTKLLLETIKKNKNNTQIKDYLLKNIFMGEGRQIKFNNNGDLENPETVVKIVKQGKFILYNQ